MHDEAVADPCETAKNGCEAAEAGLAADFPVSCAIAALTRSHRALAASLLADLGLHPGQELTLMRLWDEDGQSQKALCDALRLDHSTIAKSLRRLEETGLLTRCKSGDDARVQLVHLTEAGRALRERTRAAWAELERRTVAGLSEADQAAFVALARQIASGIHHTPD
ncbi:MarR family winged helix-turn-helix transcriptional regulator [Kaistia algarum]|uniref:MarR family winged helix-turn-helix transcriptional regulator n=1 Tax=Kaistia algarum TaxID=2083279 RepID=UPI001A9CACB9|nr:MarR family transcriptional regulator [Kaistia algarum]MCX5512142.1 MarR family transcriptional regulator [Kaistia algarum]